MLQLKKTLLALPLSFSISLVSEYKINIIFESGLEFKSQQFLVSKLKKSKSRKEIENHVKAQDWIMDYSLMFKPFKKEIYLNIKNRKPVFVLNEKFFYDEDLHPFKYDLSRGDLIIAEGPIGKPETILKLIKEIESISNVQFKIREINYSYVNGWDVISDKTLIRFGNDLSDKRLENFKDTSNYLLDIGKIPSIIDMRYKDGVALNYGK